MSHKFLHHIFAPICLLRTQVQAINVFFLWILELQTCVIMQNSMVQMIKNTCRFLATGSFYTVLDDAHGPRRATIHRNVHRVMAAIVHRLLGLISFPRCREGCREVQRRFFEMAGLPDVIGEMLIHQQLLGYLCCVTRSSHFPCSIVMRLL